MCPRTKFFENTERENKAKIHYFFIAIISILTVPSRVEEVFFLMLLPRVDLLFINFVQISLLHTYWFIYCRWNITNNTLIDFFSPCCSSRWRSPFNQIWNETLTLPRRLLRTVFLLSRNHAMFACQFVNLLRRRSRVMRLHGSRFSSCRKNVFVSSSSVP